MHPDPDISRRAGNCDKGWRCEHGDPYQQSKKEIRLYTMPFTWERTKNWCRGAKSASVGKKGLKDIALGKNRTSGTCIHYGKRMANGDHSNRQESKAE